MNGSKRTALLNAGRIPSIGLRDGLFHRSMTVDAESDWLTQIRVSTAISTIIYTDRS